MPVLFTDLNDAVAFVVRHTGSNLVVAAPLGLGKPHRLLNAIYQAIAGDPTQTLRLLTALSLTPPTASSDLERRFLEPFVARHFGEDFPVLDYARALQRDALPEHIAVEEFYMQSGALLHSAQAQRAYVSLNYTHVARGIAERGANVVVQRLAREPGGSRLSLSCNPDLTFDLLDEVAALGHARPLLVGEIDPNLPWLDGPCAVDEDFFDVLVELPGPTPTLFALPRQAVSDVDHAIGLYASTLIRDGGTLQIGIGALSDALCHALVLRHTDNATYRRVLDALHPGIAEQEVVKRSGGLGPFVEGLHGASEMVNDGFRLLVAHGVLRRRVVDDVDVMTRVVAGEARADDEAVLARDGRVLDGAFYLGSVALYDWLRGLTAEEGRTIGMTRVSHINQLAPGREALTRLQRRHMRCVNTAMMVSVLGAATSDALADGRVVSGVGGQYNFVALAHALEGGRSVLLVRSARQSRGDVASNIVWNYGHTTIPRHLRDVFVTEYGIADLRGATDETCIERMVAITDARFQSALQVAAKDSGKIGPRFTLPGRAANNTPEALASVLAPFRADGTLPDYPVGSDFTAVEERLARALGWLKAHTDRAGRVAGTLIAALGDNGARDQEALERMGLGEASSIAERVEARLVGLALRRTAREG